MNIKNREVLKRFKLKSLGESPPRIERIMIFGEYHNMKEILIGCQRGIQRVEVLFRDGEFKCRVINKFRTDEDGSNFEVIAPGETIYVLWKEN